MQNDLILVCTFDDLVQKLYTLREPFSSAKRSEVVTHNPRGGSKFPRTLRTESGNSLNSTAPHRTRFTRATARTKPFPFNFLSCSSPNPSADRRKKKGKEMVLSVGFAQKFQNNSLKQVLFLTKYRSLFLHFFANCGTTFVVI